jgi:UDP-N-acetylglucosamine--N-acetylmuramyl-(pentapeptide) pyrophosphoryl-undecaprenol N-acetylglucosamine transferase
MNQRAWFLKMVQFKISGTQIMSRLKKIIISGGGTGGHIFPAIAIANALKAKDPSVEILFVGAEGKMEMEKVPAAGYQIIGLPIQGFQRKLTFQNVVFFFKLFASMQKANSIVKGFKPDVVVGVGGYASGPLLKAAMKQGVPGVIQEQNSYAGVTNKMLAKQVQKICVAYDDMERFFPPEKIIKTGNPVRKDLINLQIPKSEALKHFAISEDKKVVLVLGGSGGARTINESIIQNIDKIKKYSGIQFILQTGKYYYKEASEKVKASGVENVLVFDFISRMDYAFTAADVVVTRSGASTVSELCLVAKPSILVPSPNVAEDHQTKNAMALVDKQAALLVTDADARDKLVNEVLKLVSDADKMKQLSLNIAKLALPNSAEVIANEILKLIKH